MFIKPKNLRSANLGNFTGGAMHFISLEEHDICLSHFSVKADQWVQVLDSFSYYIPINLSHLLALATFYGCCVDLLFHQGWKIVIFIIPTALIHSDFLIEWNLPFQPFGHLKIQFT